MKNRAKRKMSLKQQEAVISLHRQRMELNEEMNTVLAELDPLLQKLVEIRRQLAEVGMKIFRSHSRT